MDSSLESQLIDAARREGIARFVVAAALCQGDKVLLLRRRDDDFMAGLYELPGGVVEDGETLSRALGREVAEETGLPVAEVRRYLGRFDYLSAGGRATRQFNFLAAVARPGPVLLSEHSAYLWAAPQDLARLPVSDDTRRVVESIR